MSLSSNTNIFRELVANKTTHFPEFISSNTDIFREFLPNCIIVKTFSEFISHNTNTFNTGNIKQ